MKRSECAYCGETITLEGNIFLGRTVRCPVCEETSRVVKLSPLELDVEFELEFEDAYDDSDFDDYDDYDDD